MRIQRYIRKDSGEHFGEHTKISQYDFDWFLANDKIGVQNNPSAEAEEFISRFLVCDEELVVVPSTKNPCIYRRHIGYGKNRSTGIMRGNDAGEEQISGLIELIKSQQITHVYTTFEKSGRRATILTFAKTAPSSEMYDKGIDMKLRIDEQAVKEEIRTERWQAFLIARINAIRANLGLPATIY